MAKKDKKEKKKSQKEINKENLLQGISIMNNHPLFSGCMPRIYTVSKVELGTGTMCVVSSDGTLRANEEYSLSPKQWSYVLAHNILHLAFGHFDSEKMPGYTITSENGTQKKIIECDTHLWNMACDIYISKFLADIKFGQGIHDDPMHIISENPGDELKIYQYLIDQNITANRNHYGTAAIYYDSELQGLEFHQSTGRGFIPAGLIQEIRSLAMPPIPWDVELAKWFDIYFPPLEKQRTYARPSRRQMATPDIPRPRYTPCDIPTDSRTFGVVIDTSGSMNAQVIGKALGSIIYKTRTRIPSAKREATSISS